MEDLRSFRRVATRHADRTALVDEDGRTLTYAQLDDRSDALAAALDERCPDERTAALLLNGVPAIETMLAAQKRALANAQLSFRGSIDELSSMVETAGATGLIFDADNAEMGVDLVERAGLETALYVGNDPPDHPAVESYEAVVSGTSGEYDATVEPEAESAILYTSGSTGTPKAILEDQRRQWLGASQAVMEHGLTPEDVALVTTPWYHDVTTVAWIYPHLQVGATLVLQREFVPPETLSLLEAHEVTGLLAVPAQLKALLEALDGTTDLSALSYVRTGGAVVPPSLVERVEERMTEGVHNTYGLTEGIPNVTHAYPEEQADNPGTVGHASFAWEVRVVEAADPDEDPDPEATVGRGGTGELLARGPCTDGYLDNPEAEARLFVDDWLRTMDIAQVDENGGLHIVDRVDNMLVSGGENVYPQEVELVLESHPDVEAAAVVGLPDEQWGEKVAAVVVSESATAEDLDEYCLEDTTLADFKRPREYVVTDEALPRTDTGTLRREEIKAQFFGA